MEHGIKAILPTLKLKKRRTAEGYQVYNEAVQSVREELGLPPQVMDVMLPSCRKQCGWKGDETKESTLESTVEK